MSRGSVEVKREQRGRAREKGNEKQCGEKRSQLKRNAENTRRRRIKR